MEKNIKDPVKAENPTGFSVIVREFKKDKIALFSFFAVTIFIIAVFVASMFINLQEVVVWRNIFTVKDGHLLKKNLGGSFLSKMP